MLKAHDASSALTTNQRATLLPLPNYRVLDREANARLYPEGHKMYGMSIYDNLYRTIEQDTENNFWVYAQKRILPPAKSKLYRRQNNGELNDQPRSTHRFGTERRLRKSASPSTSRLTIVSISSTPFTNTAKTRATQSCRNSSSAAEAGPYLHRA